MKRSLSLAVVAFAAGASAGAQTPPPTQPPRGQMPDLGRHTQQDDQVPLFDFDAYFPGKWAFE